ncbi:NitT/TauT family transport system ATP-binding protein [Variovorax boronicumulans]|uniref:ABC transporter ATP-binding protein n=1 Tax=Variovorax boronicumulans TaxID=436515 RepID=UPI00277EA4AB|nr:ABC transporter ATP-binding protein [Variovorax boronicumulans]MDP9995723.1 NitT/TauT family transport system ATP-binding protein [Variovorax boronicumulans]MDQ0006812.1 NitT/TauT family transport system ATP-binding protein [Variovorax boronicumulans]
MKRDIPERALADVLLQLRRLGISYGTNDADERRWILRDLDLSIREGEFVTVMGSSGAGKSTLLNLVAQTLQPSAGQIAFRGEVVGGADMPSNPGSRRQIGYVTQDDNLLPWRTVWDNVMFPLTLVGKPSPSDVDRVRRLIDQVGLSQWTKHYPHQLSGGMRKRASLARTLAYNPPVVLMDEPFGALDAETRAQLQSDLLELWASERKTILFVTHDINEAIALGDRIIVLSGSPGRVVLERRIDIDRPRDPELIFKAPTFAGHYDAIRECLRSAGHP